MSRRYARADSPLSARTDNMKKITRLASVFLALAAGQAFASNCYIHAVVSSKTPRADIVLDVLQVNIPYFSSDNLKTNLNVPEQEALEARALAYAKRNAKRAEGPMDPAASFDKVSLSYGGTCYRDADHVETLRAISAKGSAILHGKWTSEELPPAKAAGAPTGKASKSSGGVQGNAAILTRSPDPSKQTPEQLAAQKKRNDANKNSEDAAASAAKSKAAKDAAAAKVREDALRQSCMRPEHRGDCGCLRFFAPDPTRKACSK